MGGLRYEVWTLPWSGTFVRVIADLPAVVNTGSGNVRLSDFASGQVGVPADYTRISEIVDTDVGSLVRVYDGSTIVHEWVPERVAYKLNTESGQVAVLSGPDLASAAFDGAVVYPFDYETNPTLLPDHIWGGKNILTNPGFETSEQRPTVYELWNDGSASDTFTLDDGTDTTSSIAWDASASTVETRLEADITAYNDVLVTGEGTVAEPWTIEFLDPFDIDDVTLDKTDTGMTSTLSTVVFGALQPTGWMKSQTVSRGVTQVFGEYTNFVVQPNFPDTGTYALFVNPVLIGRRYAGAQQVLNVTPGRTYQASVRIRPRSGTDLYRFIIRGVNGQFIASDTGGLDGTAYTVNTYSTITITDVVIPAGISQIIFRLSNVDAVGVDPAGWEMDNAVFAEGAAASTIGTIMQSLLDDAAVDHAGDTRGAILDWVDYTGFDATNDSDTTAWAQVESVTIPRGMSYGQLLDKVRGLDYEFRLTPKAVPGADTHDFDLYETDNLGTSFLAAATPSVTSGQGTVGGTIIRRIPRYTAAFTEGEGGVFVEATNATELTDFGRLETYHGDIDLTSTLSITNASSHLLAVEAGIRTAVQVKLLRDDLHPVPLVDYVVGDLLRGQFPPVVAKNDMRVLKISYKNSEPVEYQIELAIVGTEV